MSSSYPANRFAYLYTWHLPEKIRTHWIGLILISTLLLPPLKLPWMDMKLPAIRFDEVLLLLGYLLNMVLGISRHLNHWTLPNHRQSMFAASTLGQGKRIPTAFFIFGGIILLSDIFGWLVLAVPFSFREGWEFILLAKYLLLLFAGGSIPYTRGIGKTLLTYTLMGFSILVLISLGQIGNWFAMNQWLTPLIAQGHLGNLTKAAIPRALGTFGNPNYTGIFAAVSFLLSSAAFLKKPTLIWLTIALLAIKIETLVISRTALLALGAGFVVLGLHLKLWRFREPLTRAYWQNLFLIVMGAFIVFTVSPSYFFERVNEGINYTTSSSVNQHFELWQAAWENIKVSPIFGWGTAKASMTTLVDNEYLLIWRRYGLIGLFSYFYIYLNFWRLSQTQEPLLKGGVRAVLVAVMVFNLAAVSWYHFQFMSLMMIGLGILAGRSARVEVRS